MIAAVFPKEFFLGGTTSCSTGGMTTSGMAGMTGGGTSVTDWAKSDIIGSEEGGSEGPLCMADDVGCTEDNPGGRFGSVGLVSSAMLGKNNK